MAARLSQQRRTSRLSMLLASVLFSSVQAGTADTPATLPAVTGVGAFLPAVLESDKTGNYWRLMQTIAAHYVHGTIHYDVVPIMRAYQRVANGQADFGFPVMKLQAGIDAAMPYRYSSEKVGVVTFVIYSPSTRILTLEKILEAVQQGRSYNIEAPPGRWGFPTRQNYLMESAFKKLAVGRLDAFIWAQEEADSTLKKLGIKTIRRTHFADFDEVLLIPKSARGDYVDAVFTHAIRAARSDGSLGKAYAQVHRPYDDWQP